VSREKWPIYAENVHDRAVLIHHILLREQVIRVGRH
jgi:hypothetical protein